MNSRKFKIVLCALIILSVIWVATDIAHAQSGGWSEPYRLSSADGKSSESYLVADQYGFVHCFWIETLFETQKSVIQYARFDGVTWTNPNDIFVARIGIEDLSVAVDQHGTLHMVWSEGLSGPLYYSYAPASDAQSTKNWSVPIQLDIPAGIVRLQIDSKDIFHIVFINRGVELGVYYVRSEDQGTTWSEPIWIDPDIPLNYTPANLNFDLDQSDGLHVVWNYGALELDATNFNMVRYTHSLDGGNTWMSPFVIDQYIEGTDYDLDFAEPRMILQNNTVHVIWAAGDLPYRHHRFSTDSGQTWSTPAQILGELHGQAFDGLAVDGAGRVHFFGQIRYPMGIYHTYWDRMQWVPPALIYFIAQEDLREASTDQVHAHYTYPVVRAGNQLVLTFTDGPADPNRRLFAMVYTMNDILPFVLEPTPIPTATPLPEPSPTVALSTPLSTATATPVSINTIPPPEERAARPDLVLWFTLVPNILLLVGTIIFRTFYKFKFQNRDIDEHSKD